MAAAREEGGRERGGKREEAVSQICLSTGASLAALGEYERRGHQLEDRGVAFDRLAGEGGGIGRWEEEAGKRRQKRGAFA